MPYQMSYCTLRHLWRRHQILKVWTRSLFSETGKWDEPIFNADLLKKIEAHWKPILLKRNLDRLTDPEEKKKPKHYVLSMFPYPSGNLHMGHVRVYTISDVISRYEGMKGKQVIQPMGWDAFGLPAENAAIERNVSPEEWTKSNIRAMKSQLENMCCNFDWDKEFATCDPEYYKWTQHIFLKMYEAGLIYQKEDAVNWDPIDMTVLANEQIDENGCSWRSGAKAEKKYLRQWFIRTTAYAKSLLDGLSEVEQDLWRGIIDIQKFWIGDCKGCNLDFKIKKDGKILDDHITVYTESPELIYGLSHIAIAPDNKFDDPLYYKEGFTSVDLDIPLTLEAIHPLTNQAVPLIVSKSAVWNEYSDMKLGFPDVCDTDASIASKFGFSWSSVLILHDGEKKLSNSDQLSDLTRKEAFEAVLQIAKDMKIGGHLTSARLKDWLISRQRYWGTPIPIIHCSVCKVVPVPYEDLPVKLPAESMLTSRSSSLKQNTEWLKTTCPKCGGTATRESDTMDTFVDSSWYFLRYLDATNTSQPFDSEKIKHYMPVDLYIGGKEHALMHLFYARFFNHFLYDEGLVNVKEPFYNLLTSAWVMSQSYRTKDGGRYLPKEDVDFTGPKPVEKGTGAELIVEWEKMSKSKFNGADPQEFIDMYGVDSTRMSIVAGAGPYSVRNWSKDLYVGTLRWQTALWKLVGEYIAIKNTPACTVDLDLLRDQDQHINSERNNCLYRVGIALDYYFNTGEAISRFHSILNFLKKVPTEVQQHSEEFERALTDLVLLTAPFTPNFAEELFLGLSSVGSHSNYKWDKSVFNQHWPVLDSTFTVKMFIQRNLHDVFTIDMPVGTIPTLTKDNVLKQCSGNSIYNTFIAPVYTDCEMDLCMKKLKMNFIVPLNEDTEKIEMQFRERQRQRKKEIKKQEKLKKSAKKQ